MATSAKSEVKCGYNGHYHLYMTITVNSQDIANNRSNVTVKMYAKSDSSSYGAYNLSSSANTVKMTVNGSQVVNKTMAMDFRNKATVNLASWTGNISHGSDGTKNLSCSGSFTISGSSYLSGGDISASIALDAIPRATVPTLSAGSVAIGSALTIKLSPAVSGWTHKLYYKYGSNSRVQLATSAGNYSWTLPTSLASYLPSATSGTLTIEVDTYNGSTKIGSTQSVTVTMTVPASMVPSISSVAVSEAGTGLSGLYVQGKSKFRIKTTAAGINGSSIASITHKVGGSTYTASADYTTGVVNSSGTVAIVTTVKDSRGRTASKTTNVTVYAYSPPQITAFQAIRSNSAGAANNNGTYGKITAAFAISSVNSKNANSYKIEYRQSGAASWTSLKTGTGYSYSGDTITGSVFSVANTYEIRMTVTDSFTSATATIQLSTAFRLISYIIAKSALAFGKIAELANIFEVAMETIFQKIVTFNATVNMMDDLTVVGDISEGGAKLSSKYNPLINPTYGTPSAAISFPSGTWTVIAKLSLKPGKYLLIGGITWNSNTTGARACGWHDAVASPGRWGTEMYANVSGETIRMQSTRMVTMTATKTWYFLGYQRGGSTLSTEYAYWYIIPFN